MRRQCNECPFNSKSKYFDEWPDELKNMQFEAGHELPQGCHMIENSQNDSPFQENPDLQCVGHIKYMKNVRKNS